MAGPCVLHQPAPQHQARRTREDQSTCHQVGGLHEGDEPVLLGSSEAGLRPGTAFQVAPDELDVLLGIPLSPVATEPLANTAPLVSGAVTSAGEPAKLALVAPTTVGERVIHPERG